MMSLVLRNKILYVCTVQALVSEVSWGLYQLLRVAADMMENK